MIVGRETETVGSLNLQKIIPQADHHQHDHHPPSSTVQGDAPHHSYHRDSCDNGCRSLHGEELHHASLLPPSPQSLRSVTTAWSGPLPEIPFGWRTRPPLPPPSKLELLPFPLIDTGISASLHMLIMARALSVTASWSSREQSKLVRTSKCLTSLM